MGRPVEGKCRVALARERLQGGADDYRGVVDGFRFGRKPAFLGRGAAGQPGVAELENPFRDDGDAPVIVLLDNFNG